MPFYGNEPKYSAEQLQELKLRVDVVRSRGKFVSNEEIIIYVQWSHERSRTWCYKYLIPYIKWHRPKLIPSTKFLNFDDACQQIAEIMEFNRK